MNLSDGGADFLRWLAGEEYAPAVRFLTALVEDIAAALTPTPLGHKLAPGAGTREGRPTLCGTRANDFGSLEYGTLTCPACIVLDLTPATENVPVYDMVAPENFRKGERYAPADDGKVTTVLRPANVTRHLALHLRAEGPHATRGYLTLPRGVPVRVLCPRPMTSIAEHHDRVHIAEHYDGPGAA